MNGKAVAALVGDFLLARLLDKTEREKYRVLLLQRTRGEADRMRNGAGRIFGTWIQGGQAKTNYIKPAHRFPDVVPDAPRTGAREVWAVENLRQPQNALVCSDQVC